MKKIEMIKGTTSLIISIGAGSIVGNIVNATLPPQASLVIKVCTQAAGMAMGGMAAVKLTNYTENWIDEIASSLKGVVIDNKK